VKEITFLKERAVKWEEFENLLKEKHANPRELAGLFVEVTDDLSYSRTNYPKSKTTQYLNGLAARVHQEIYKNKKESRGRVFSFWKTEVPLSIAKHQKLLFVSFFVFALCSILGFVSEMYDENFVRLILGDGYVDETLQRIKEGKPLGIYGEGEQGAMFFRITLNNILVSFRVFAMGLLFSFGTGFELFRNGVMLGAFHGFFWRYHLFTKSLLVVWIHGTFEISAIVIAGAAGFVLGNSLLFPGTYKRMESFKRGALNSLKIVIGVVPIFIVAGFLESFITRYTEMPLWTSLFIIFGSLTFVLWYFVLLPLYLSRKITNLNLEHGKN
jgi:uncharacterized membrane protein SpoIIM required for sporulation